jgi:multiple sugar transport system permease protein
MMARGPANLFRGLLLSAFLVLLPASAGCGAGGDDAVILRVMVTEPTFEAYPTFCEVGRDFEERKRREGVNVEVRFLSESGGGDNLTKLKIMLAGRQPLDVTWIDIIDFSQFLDDNVVLDLQPFFDADPTWNRDDYFEPPLQAFSDRQGHLYGLPSTFTPYVMYYNKDILAAAGIAAPKEGWTWDDLRTACLKVTRDLDGDGRSDQWGISITQWLQAIAPWIWQNGGGFMDGTMTHCTLDEPGARGAIGFLEQLLYDDGVATSDATFDAQFTEGLFQAGKVAFYGPVGYWETYRFKKIDAFRWDVAPLPRNKHSATSIALRSYVVCRDTEHPQLAYEFLRALAGEKLQRELARIGNGVPGLKSAAFSEDFLKPDVPPDSEQVFLDVIANARFQPVFANWRDIEQLVQTELEQCFILRTMNAGEACDAITRKANDFLARQRADLERPRLPLSTAAFVLAGGLCLLIALFLLLRGKRPSRLRRREERFAAVLLAPWGVGFVFLVLCAMLVSLLISLTIWSPIRPVEEARWAGLANYGRLVESDVFWKSLSVTTAYAVPAVVIGLCVALFLACLVNRAMKGISIFRTLFFIPAIISPVAMAVIWVWLFNLDNPESGLVNQALALVGIEGPDWKNSQLWLLVVYILLGVWGIGFQMVVFLAGLQGINRDLYDAARVDGAPPWRQFFHITIPQLSPVILFNMIIGIINAFQLFAQPFIMTQGGPGTNSLFLVLYIFREAFRLNHMGYASALAWVMFFILLLLTVVILRSSKGWAHYEGGTA